VLDISYAQIDLVITHVIQLRTSHRIYLLVWFGKTTGFGLEGAAIGSIPILVASCWYKWPALCWFDLIKKNYQVLQVQPFTVGVNFSSEFLVV
jgi:hypothetical protein